MIVRRLDDIIGTENEVAHNTWVSRRLLLKRDNMGFSMHDTIIRAGTETEMWYRNHLEAVYCIEGEGEVTLLETDERIPIRPGTMYALDGHERHLLRAITDLRMLCVFTPPLTGREVHDEEGVYPLLTEDPVTEDSAAPA